VRKSSDNGCWVKVTRRGEYDSDDAVDADLQVIIVRVSRLVNTHCCMRLSDDRESDSANLKQPTRFIG